MDKLKNIMGLVHILSVGARVYHVRLCYITVGASW